MEPSKKDWMYAATAGLPLLHSWGCIQQGLTPRTGLFGQIVNTTVVLRCGIKQLRRLGFVCSEHSGHSDQHSCYTQLTRGTNTEKRVVCVITIDRNPTQVHVTQEVWQETARLQKGSKNEVKPLNLREKELKTRWTHLSMQLEDFTFSWNDIVM